MDLGKSRNDPGEKEGEIQIHIWTFDRAVAVVWRMLGQEELETNR